VDISNRKDLTSEQAQMGLVRAIRDGVKDDLFCTSLLFWILFLGVSLVAPQAEWISSNEEFLALLVIREK